MAVLPDFSSFFPDLFLKMMNSEETGRDSGGTLASSAFTLLIIFFSLIAIVSTFLLAISTVDVGVKVGGFSAILAVLITLALGLSFWQSGRRTDLIESEFTSGADLEQNLRGLDEANEYFAGSLTTGDTLRLVGSRVRMIVPLSGIALFLVDASQTRLEVAATDADHAGLEFDEEIAGQCYAMREVRFIKSSRHGKGDSQGFAAIPLFSELELFGVLELSFDAVDARLEPDRSLLEAIGTRVAPLILSSVAFERSRMNALTDSTTDLPNERAFYLILENQIAESQRKQESRPLTVLAMDIKNFDEINQSHGHAAGDRVLNFVAEIARDNLRQMDFFVRSMNDEFLAVLPTATKEISHEIVARIHTGFFGRKLKISEGQSIEIELNVGWATFGLDGETPAQLLTLARLRKEQAKSPEPPKVLWFPKELVN